MKRRVLLESVIPLGGLAFGHTAVLGGESIVSKEKETETAIPAAQETKNPDKILIVVTSHSELGNTGKKTGYWQSEVSHPWKIFKDAGYQVDFVSPKGGDCPVEGEDPKDPVNKEFLSDIGAQRKIHGTMKPAQVNPADYKAIFYAGGHGVMWDFPDNKELQEIARKIYENGGVVSAVCHGPAGLVNIKLSNGKYLVDGKHINSFTDAEEKALGLDKVVPFLLETELKKRGAIFEKSDMWQPHVVSNERVVTGQNPMSANAVAEAVVTALK